MAQVKWVKWALIGAAVALLGATLALLLWPRPVPVADAALTIGPIADAVADQGSARVREAYIVSAPVSGRLERVELHVGDRITTGITVVARIRPASADLLDSRSRAQATAAVAAANAAVAAASAQYDQLQAEAVRVENDLGRIRRLSDAGYASRQSLETLEAQARAARAASRAALAQLAVRRSELAAARAVLMAPDREGGAAVDVRSPASGLVTRILQESARTVAVGAPLVEVADTSGLEAAIEFSSQDAVRIREGMAAEIYDWGGDGALAAVVRRVEPQAFTKVSALGVEEQRALVLLQFTGDPARWARLGPGYRVWGRVFLRREPQALKAPLGALVRDGGQWAVFRIVGGRARLTRVQVGALTSSEAEIRGGLGRSDRVIVFPSDRVVDGARVRVRPVGG